MPIEAGATYVFDLGYYDFGFFSELDALGCRLVTRFKTNTPLNEPRDLPLEPGSTVLSDRIGFLPARQAMNRKNPMQDAVREIVVRTEAGETLRLLTNDLDAPAQEIADLYKRRWQIELFFRLMKQTLRITKFIGRSENAVRIQIAAALIAFLLLRALQQIAKETHGFLELVRLVRANLMHRKDPTPTPQTPASPAARLKPTPTLPLFNLNRTPVPPDWDLGVSQQVKNKGQESSAHKALFLQDLTASRGDVGLVIEMVGSGCPGQAGSSRGLSRP